MSRESNYIEKKLFRWQVNYSGYTFIGPLFIIIAILFGLLKDFIALMALLLMFVILMEIIIFKISYKRRIFSISRFSILPNNSPNSSVVNAIEKSLQSLETEYYRLSNDELIREWPLVYTEIFILGDTHYISVEKEIDKYSFINFGRFPKRHPMSETIMKTIDKNVAQLEQQLDRSQVYHTSTQVKLG